VASFLPLSTQTKYYSHRKRVSELPLFPGYVFVRAAPEPLWGAMPTGKVVRLIPVADQSGLAADLLQVYRALSEGSGVTRVARLPVGSPVRVSSGPLRDVIGLVEREGGRGRLVIAVRALGQGVSVEIESDLLEPAGEAASR
jgi:transcription antitermination factor NusG